MIEAFIRNFSAPYSLLQRHLVGEEDRKKAAGDTKHPDEHQHSPPHPLITELTTSSFLPCVMDLQKVRNPFSIWGIVPNQLLLSGNQWNKLLVTCVCSP